MSRLAPDDICAFLINEARYLDERRWEDWLSLFADDGWYWVPIEEGQTDPRTTVSLMYDDRQLLETRVRRLKACWARHPRAFAGLAQPASYCLSTPLPLLQHLDNVPAAQHVAVAPAAAHVPVGVGYPVHAL